MLKEKISLKNGKKVKIFLGGDLNFLSACLGHQGQASSYPSHLDLVELAHLRNHAGKPHTQKDCENFCKERTITDYGVQLAENLCDDRQGGINRKTGKEHNSIIDAMLFPLKSLDDVVPPILHIFLGGTLRLWEFAEEFAIEQDTKTKRKQNKDTKVQKKNYNELMKKKADIETCISSFSSEIVDIKNFYERLESLEKDPKRKDIDTLSLTVSTNHKKGKEVLRSECSSDKCIVSQYDANRSWVECKSENCPTSWVHLTCDGLVNSEGIDIEQNLDEEYFCLSCRGISSFEDKKNHLHDKIQGFMEIQNEYCQKKSDILIQMDNLKSEIECVMGPREKKLNDVLKILKIETSISWKNICRKSLRNCIKKL